MQAGACFRRPSSLLGRGLPAQQAAGPTMGSRRFRLAPAAGGGSMEGSEERPAADRPPAGRPESHRTMKRYPAAVGCLSLLAALLPAADAPPAIDPGKLPPATPRAIDFRRDVEPIFARACVSCHGPAKQRGGLRLDDRTTA